ncbi:MULTISPECIES: LysR family transcriptional regulator [unclassified Clostridium]|uniref:LysR family transcriptional regulator n=1 Tax=unclassified Clostridium TaxID=2614128 RepID=UPI001EEEC0A2|nr:MULTISPECIES: LysR family transcriptional regulator [unclassified Clostridium]
MTLQQLKYALEIARYGSINEAAKKLFISQPSLSNSIRELESELGIVIFERTNRGISISSDGIEFLGYARQISEQAEFIEDRYHGRREKIMHFSVSTQHYAFVVNAFTKLLKEIETNQYEFNLRETKTYEIIDDVKTLRSDVGILYINEVNSKVMNRIFSDSNLKFTPLFNANPHIIISNNHPLSTKESVTTNEMLEFTYITFEQGINNSFNFSEEMMNMTNVPKSIKVIDRATLSTLLTSTDSYTIGTGFIDSDFDESKLKAIPIECDEIFTVGWIAHKDIKLNKITMRYIEILNEIISTNYLDLNYYLL